MTDKRETHRDIGTFWISLGMGTRVANCLANARIESVAQLRALGMMGFLRLPNAGRISAEEITDTIGWGTSSLPPPPDALDRIATALERIATWGDLK